MGAAVVERQVQVEDAGTAFDAWVRPHLPVMGRVAARLAPGADAEDVVQEALTRAWRKRHTYDPARGSASAWLCAVVADQARAARRRHRTTEELPDAVAPAASPERDLDLERAVARLSQRQREAVDLHYFAGLSVDETAVVMGCASGTVKSTLSDARARLRVLLEEGG